MKKIIAVLLAMTFVLSCISAVSAAETRTWGADNLNNSSGDLVIGFLGGSITEGCGAATKDDRWSTLVVNGYFKKNFPNNPKIKQVNVGLNCNGLRDLFDKDKIKTTKQLKGINFSLYGNLNDTKLLWNGDWEEGQYCLLNSVQLRKANVLMNKNNNNNNEDCVITK